MFLHSLVTPVSSISGVLQGFRRARHQVIKYQLFSVCHGNPHASFLIGKHMDNRKPASSNRGEDREVFSVVPIRELSAKYLISKGFLNIRTCLSRKSSVCRLQRTAQRIQPGDCGGHRRETVRKLAVIVHLEF